MSFSGSRQVLALSKMNSFEWTLPAALGGAMILAGTAVFTTVSLVRSTSQAASLLASAAPVSTVARAPVVVFTPVSVYEQSAVPAALHVAAGPAPSSPVATKNSRFRVASVEPAGKPSNLGTAVEAPAKAPASLNPPVPIPERATATREHAIDTPAKPEKSREHAVEESAKAPTKHEMKLASRGPSGPAARDAQTGPEQWRALKTSKANAFNLGGHIDQAGVVDTLASTHLRDAFKTLTSYQKLPQHVRNLIEAQNINLSKLAPYRLLLGIHDKKLEDEQAVRFEKVVKH
jgi:hypothetical protein